MRSTIRQLNPIKIQNRLVPKSPQMQSYSTQQNYTQSTHSQPELVLKQPIPMPAGSQILTSLVANSSVGAGLSSASSVTNLTSLSALSGFSAAVPLTPSANSNSSSLFSSSSLGSGSSGIKRLITQYGTTSNSNNSTSGYNAYNGTIKTARVIIRRADSVRSANSIDSNTGSQGKNQNSLEKQKEQKQKQKQKQRQRFMSPSYGTPQHNKSSQYYYINRQSPSIPTVIGGGLNGSRVQASSPLTSDYYNQMENKITFGIKKLQQLDKKLSAYDYKNPDITPTLTGYSPNHNSPLREKQKDKKQQIKLYPTNSKYNTYTSTLATNQSPNPNNSSSNYNSNSNSNSNINLISSSSSISNTNNYTRSPIVLSASSVSSGSGYNYGSNINIYNGNNNDKTPIHNLAQSNVSVSSNGSYYSYGANRDRDRDIGSKQKDKDNQAANRLSGSHVTYNPSTNNNNTTNNNSTNINRLSASNVTPSSSSSSSSYPSYINNYNTMNFSSSNNTNNSTNNNGNSNKSVIAHNSNYVTFSSTSSTNVNTISNIGSSNSGYNRSYHTYGNNSTVTPVSLITSSVKNGSVSNTTTANPTNTNTTSVNTNTNTNNNNSNNNTNNIQSPLLNSTSIKNANLSTSFSQSPLTITPKLSSHYNNYNNNYNQTLTLQSQLQPVSISGNQANSSGSTATQNVSVKPMMHSYHSIRQPRLSEPMMAPLSVSPSKQQQTKQKQQPSSPSSSPSPSASPQKPITQPQSPSIPSISSVPQASPELTSLLLQLQSQKSHLQSLIQHHTTQNSLLQQTLQQKTKQLNTRTSQQISSLKRNFQQKQSSFLKQIKQITEKNTTDIEQLIACHRIEVEKLKRDGDERVKMEREGCNRDLGKLKDQWQYERNYFNSQYKNNIAKVKSDYEAKIKTLENEIQKNKSVIDGCTKWISQRDGQIGCLKLQSQKKQSRIDQANKLHEYYKNQYKKIEQKYKQQQLKQSQLTSTITTLSSQIQSLENNAVHSQQLNNTKFQTQEQEIKRLKSLNQSYAKENIKQRTEIQVFGKKMLEYEERVREGEVMVEEIRKNKGDNQLQILRNKIQSLQQIIAEHQQSQKQSQSTQKLSQQKIRQLQQKLQQTQTQLSKQQSQHLLQTKSLKQQLDSKSKQIFQKLTDYYQQKQRLGQQILNYKNKIQQKEKELNQQGYKLNQIENMVRINEKEISVGRVQFESLGELVRKYKRDVGVIRGVVEKQWGELGMYEGMDLGEETEVKGMVEIQLQDNKIILNIVKKICNYNKKLIQKYTILINEAKKQNQIKNIPQKDKIKKTISIQQQSQTKYPKLNLSLSQICPVSIHATPAQPQPQRQPSPSPQLQSLKSTPIQPQAQIQKPTQFLYPKTDQVLALREQLEQKQKVIDVMEQCIEDYKQMAKDMKSKLQGQNIIQKQYAQILDFFQIDPNKNYQSAHEQLMQILQAFTNKLQKMVHTVSDLQSQLTKTSQQNQLLREKKKKMIRQLKRCQQLIEKACTENQQLQIKVHLLDQKIQRGDVFVKELGKMMAESNQQIIKSCLTMSNFKYQRLLQQEKPQQQTQNLQVTQAQGQCQKHEGIQNRTAPQTIPQATPAQSEQVLQTESQQKQQKISEQIKKFEPLVQSSSQQQQESTNSAYVSASIAAQAQVQAQIQNQNQNQIQNQNYSKQEMGKEKEKEMQKQTDLGKQKQTM